MRIQMKVFICFGSYFLQLVIRMMVIDQYELSSEPIAVW
jgi:hypothetical protein